MKSFWVILVDPKSTDSVFIRERKRRGPCEDTSRGWSNVATNQGMCGATESWKKQGRILSQHLSRECSSPADTLISGLLASRTVGEYISVVSGRQFCGHLLWQPQETTQLLCSILISHFYLLQQFYNDQLLQEHQNVDVPLISPYSPAIFCKDL